MKHALLAAALALTAARPAPAAEAGGEPIAHQYLILLAPGQDAEQAASALGEAHELAVVRVFRRWVDGFSALIPPLKLAAVRADPRVRALGQDRTLAAYGSSAALPPGPGVSAAMLDSLMGADLPALAGRVAGGATLLSFEEGAPPGGQDDHGHGTALAQSAAASAPSAALWAVKVLGRGGAGSITDLIAGLEWLADGEHPPLSAAVLGLRAVCALCVPGSEDPAIAALEAAARGAAARGIALLAPAGKAGEDPGVPAAFDSVTEQAAPAAPAASGSDGSFRLGEVYAFPNPARAGAVPVFHAEVGIADRVEFRVYDLAGNLVHQAELAGAPRVVDDGQGPQYAYESPWEGRIASGVYLFIMRAQRAGETPLTATGRLGVVR